jgi:hypothetical protein
LFTKLLVLLFAICLFPVCHAQANELGISIGGIFSPNSVGFTPPVGCIDCVSPNPATANVAFAGVFAHRLLNLDIASLHLELPILGAPNRIATGGNFSAIYFTPALKVKFSLPLISPFLSAGGGFAHFSSTNATLNNAGTKEALQAGAGFDVSTPIPLIGLRGEVREFYTGTFANTRHNVFVGGGIVFKF